MKNIEIFKAISGLVYAKLYDNFPLKIKLSPSSLAVELDDEFWSESQTSITESVSEYNRNRSPAAIAKPTIEWLSNSGLITYDRYHDHEFEGVCLTAKGLESIEANSSGRRLVTAMADLAKEELKGQAKNQLNSIFSKALSWSIEKSPTIIQTISNYAQ